MLSVIALVLDKSVEAIVMFADPSKLCPAIVLALANAVAVAANPTAILALPSNDVPPIVLAVARAVAVEALPVKAPVTLPSMLATNVPVEIVMLPVLSAVAVVVPTVNLSALSSHAIIAIIASRTSFD